MINEAVRDAILSILAGFLGFAAIVVGFAIRSNADGAWLVGSYLVIGFGFVLLYAAWRIYRHGLSRTE